MTLRAIILGIAIGLLVILGTYVNDAVIRQTFFIGNHLPVSVFGVVIFGAIFAGPFIGRWFAPLQLRPAEWMVAMAIGLAACGWPASGLYRTALTSLAMPSTLEKSRTAWTAAGVMSYVPGGSSRLAPGQVLHLGQSSADDDGPAVPPLAEALSTAEAGSVAHAVWLALPPGERSELLGYAQLSRVSAGQTERAVQSLNRAIEEPGWVLERPEAPIESGSMLSRSLEDYHRAVDEARAMEAQPLPDDPAAADAHRLHIGYLWAQARDAMERSARWAMVESLPQYVLPPPPGTQGLLVTGGRVDPWATDPLFSSRPRGQWWSVSQLPWPALRPVITLWGPLLAMMGLASVCLALIVHPQWSNRELLPYPLAQFAADITERDEGRLLPRIGTNKAFWIAFALVFGLHLVNGMHTWFPALPEISLTFNLDGLRKLVPMISAANQSQQIFTAVIYLSVVAFAFFLSPQVSFSVGISVFVWVGLGALMLANGTQLRNPLLESAEGNWIRFGAYTALTLTILFTGRRYYASVLLDTVRRWPRPGASAQATQEVPMSAVWSARLLFLLVIGSVYWLCAAGLTWYWAVAAVAMLLMMWLVLSRVVSETGLFYIQPNWVPVGTLMSLVGFETLGPSGFIVLSLLSVILAGDPREALLPYVSTGLAAAERNGGTKPGRLAMWLGAMAIVSLVGAGVWTMWWQYNNGIDHADSWAKEWLPVKPFDALANQLKEVQSEGRLEEVLTADRGERLSFMSSEKGAWAWVIAGLVLTAGAAWARLRLPWWPIHPVLFIVVGAVPASRFAWSFVVGWLVKLAVVKIAGSRGYQAVKPVMIGVIAGEILGAFLWIVVGAIYYGLTGLTPESYRVFPG